jgi:Golgi SNAP receptor complex protein 2
METLYHQTNRIFQETQDYFVRLERTQAEEDVQRLQKDIEARLEQLWSNCERLDMLANKEPVTRRQNAKLRVDQLKYDIQHLNSALQSMQNRALAREQLAAERELLLNTKFTTNLEASSETSIMIDRALEHGNALNRSNKYMDDILAQGTAALGNLRDQRSVLKGAQKKILDVANTLGMSNTVIRLIERRGEGDKYILIGGMVVTCVFMFLIVKYFT